MKNSLSNTGLSNDVITKIQDVFKQFHEIKTVVLYGSRAIGNYRNGSDIDLTIKLKPDIESSIRLLNKISMSIDDLNLIYSFDLSLFVDISNDDLIDHINRVGVELYNSLSQIKIDEDTTQALKIVKQALIDEKAKVYLFGSRANNTYHKHSDVDVAVLATNFIPLYKMAEIRELLIQSNILYEVDLIDLNSVDEKFKNKVLEDGLLWSD